MRKIFFFIIGFSLFSGYLLAFPIKPLNKQYSKNSKCEARLETEVRRKPIQFLFYDPVRFKVTTIDKILDSNNIVLKAKSYSIWSMDAGDFIRFRRFLIEDDKILEFKFWAKSKHGKILTYNLCGEKIKAERILIDDFWDRYYEIHYKK